ncbi:MAG: CDP-diacylglycerol--serine O-phosphatidyltransferase [Myxococcota bacterium]|nr:CDP-diacylglycerol--serine O-phosphatidyltransferase [Myxococcota bacterium]MDW8363259.1 CDP-diacylglycerol--serine O-phosphatidyltransferase [Myxococcales bacterium]
MKVNLRKTLFILPNLFTLSSVFCGLFALLTCTTDPDADAFHRAALLVVFAMFFDAIDGRVARLTRTQSAFGVQMDSLADIVSFGVAPAVLVYRWSLEPLGWVGVLGCFAFVACGAIRLARFNVLSMGESGAPRKPGKYILGLPIPGAAGILVSLVVANHAVAGSLPALRWVVLAVVLVLSFFMVSTIRFRSFKDVKLSPRTVAMVLVALGSAVAISLRFHPSFALVWLLACYVTIGLVETFLDLSRRVTRRAPRSRVVRAADGTRGPSAEP